MSMFGLRWIVAPVAVALSVSAGCKSVDPKAASDGTILTPYLAIGNVLASDEVDHLGELSAAVIEAAQEQGDAPGVDAIVQGAGRVPAQDIATARTGFRTLSRGMIDYMKAEPAKQAGHVIIHCTMTFNGDGAAWVQAQGDIMNPYEGAMMLHCGDLVAWDADVPKF
jgi:Cu(I)/Ag(I) efflux system membrane fusion protein